METQQDQDQTSDLFVVSTPHGVWNLLLLKHLMVLEVTMTKVVMKMVLCLKVGYGICETPADFENT